MKHKFYGKYKNVRNAAWQFLIDFHIDALPLNMANLCEQLGIALLSYDRAQSFIDQFQLTEQANKNDGFTICLDDYWYILYRDWRFSSATINRTIAHELGHILLGHELKAGGTSLLSYTRQNVQSIENDGMEREADMFAVRILAPACVLKELKVSSYTQLMNLCFLPKLYAVQRMKRLEELYRRDLFYKDPMERRVAEQFSGFIAHKRNKLL